MKKQGFALVYEHEGKYHMTTVHKTAECAITNGISIFSGSRVVAIVPVDFEDNNQNIHLIFGDEELRLQAISDAEKKASFTTPAPIEANLPGRLYTADSYASTAPDK